MLALVIWGAIGNFAFDVAAIAAAFHAVGVDGLPIGLLILAYVLGHAGAIIPLPGSSEGGLIGMFVLYGATLSGATAASGCRGAPQPCDDRRSGSIR